MTRAERRRRADNLCRRLASDIADLSPVGLGSWLPDGHPALTVSQDFLDALAAWEREEGNVDQVREAYDQVLEAWRQAAETFRAQSNCRTGEVRA